MDITELIIDPNTTITLPGATIVRLLDKLRESNSQRDTYKLTADAASEQVEMLTTEAAAAHNEVLALRAQVTGLEKALKEATKPPVTVPPVVIPPTPPIIPNPIPTKPTISKTEITGLAALTIENGDDEPGLDQYALMRKVLTQAADMKFNAGRWFMNAFEVAKHQTLKETDENHLPGFAMALGITYIADTVDSEVWRVLKIESDLKKTSEEKAKATAGLKAYLEGLAKLGAKAFVVNDANQYREMKALDGTLLYPSGTLERIVERIRAITPNMPLIASLTASATIGEYPMFDFFEAQTFGTPDHVRQFLARPFDIFCLDARRQMSAVDITTRAAIILAAKPKAFFYYTDRASDWANMPLDKVSAIRRMIEAWKTRG